MAAALLFTYARFWSVATMTGQVEAGDKGSAVSTIRVGPGGIPSRDDPAAAIATLIERGYDACEIDFSDGFWMDRDYAQRLGSLARDAALALSIHAPLAAFLGHVQHGGAKQHTAGVPARPP